MMAGTSPYYSGMHYALLTDGCNHEGVCMYEYNKRCNTFYVL